MAQGFVELVFPTGGVDRSTAYQRQRPYTTPDALNVRAESAEDQRERGGSRPGLVKAFAETLGSGQPIRMLENLTFLRSEVGGGDVFVDEFRNLGTLSNQWSAPEGAGYALAATAGDEEDVPDTASGKSGGILDLIPHPTASPYTVQMVILPYNGRHRAGTRYLWAGMDESTPDETDRAIELSLAFTDSPTAYPSGSLKFRTGGAVTSGNTFNFSLPKMAAWYAKPMFVTVRISGTTVDAYVDGLNVVSNKTCPWSPATHRRYGFGLVCATPAAPAGQLMMVDRFEIRYAAAKTDIGSGNQVVAVANGQLWVEDSNGAMVAVTTSTTLNPDVHLMAAERGGKLYIADFSDSIVMASAQTAQITSGDSPLVFTGYVGSDTDDGFTLGNGSSTSVVAASAVTIKSSTAALASRTTTVFRFPGLTVPADKTIRNAYITPFFLSGYANNIRADITCELIADSPALGSAENLRARNETVASVLWDGATAGGRVQSPDIAAAVREVYALSGHLSGVALSVMLAGRSDANAESRPLSIYSSSGYAAKLTITYEDDAGSLEYKLTHPGTDFVSVTPAISTKDHMVEIYNAVTASNNGVYKIRSVSASALTLDVTSLTPGSCQYRVARGPKVYDPALGTLELLTATAGTPPLMCDKVVLNRDRLVWSREQEWFMAAVGRPTDYNYGALAEDKTRAVAGVSSEAGVMPREITAIAPHISDYMLFWTNKETFVLRGDPVYGGRLDRISDVIGCVDRRAWCKTPSGAFMFLSQDGVYTLEPGASTTPESLSREKLPKELRDINPEVDFVQMVYSARFRGVHIFVTRIDGTQSRHWWFDVESGGFWPEQYHRAYEPWSLLAHQPADGSVGSVLLGCRDGVIRRHDESAFNDDGTYFQSYVDFGPIMLGRPGTEGVWRTATSILGADSAPVQWLIRVGDSANQAALSLPADSGDWNKNGLGLTTPIRRAGGAALLRVRDINGYRWSMESIIAEIEAAGPRRV